MSFSSNPSTPDLPISEQDTAKKLAAIEYCQLGDDLLAIKQYDSAQAAYECAIYCDPTLAIAYSGFARSCYHLSEYAAALIAIELAIDLSPKGIDYYYQRDLIVRSLSS